MGSGMWKFTRAIIGVCGLGVEVDCRSVQCEICVCNDECQRQTKLRADIADAALNTSS